jgi:hypothetical protein
VSPILERQIILMIAGVQTPVLTGGSAKLEPDELWSG